MGITIAKARFLNMPRIKTFEETRSLAVSADGKETVGERALALFQSVVASVRGMRPKELRAALVAGYLFGATLAAGIFSDKIPASQAALESIRTNNRDTVVSLSHASTPESSSNRFKSAAAGLAGSSIAATALLAAGLSSKKRDEETLAF